MMYNAAKNTQTDHGTVKIGRRFLRAVAWTPFSDPKKHQTNKETLMNNRRLKPPQRNKGPRAKTSTKHRACAAKSLFFMVPRFQEKQQKQN